ncbi:MAG: LuxR C-terminal-related transcriptional regulator [Anaerolineae bacterium]
MAMAASIELSERELELLALLVTGATNQQIALKLHISVNTVKTHLRNIFYKLGVESRTEATLYAIQHNLVQMSAIAVAGASTEVEEIEPVPPHPPEVMSPQRLLWAPTWGVYTVLAVVLAILAAGVFWPLQAARTATASNPFIDPSTGQEAPLPTSIGSRWHKQPTLGQPRARFAQVTVSGTVYVIAGLTGEGWTAAVESYSPVEKRWQRRTDKPIPVANISAVLVDGLIYVPGGLDASSQAINVLEIYDPETDSWRSGAPLPRPVCAYAIAPTAGGFYLFGGWDGSNYLRSVYYYDVAADAWYEETLLRTPIGFAAAATGDGVIYLVGGYDGKSVLATCESFDPSLARAGQDPWRTLAPLTTARAGLGLAALNGSLYAVGGGWLSPITNNERYDVANNIWSTFDTPFISAWRSLGLSTIDTHDGTFLVAVGGWSGGYLAATWFYQAVFRVYLP